MGSGRVLKAANDAMHGAICHDFTAELVQNVGSGNTCLVSTRQTIQAVWKLVISKRDRIGAKTPLNFPGSR